MLQHWCRDGGAHDKRTCAGTGKNQKAAAAAALVLQTSVELVRSPLSAGTSSSAFGVLSAQVGASAAPGAHHWLLRGSGPEPRSLLGVKG